MKPPGQWAWRLWRRAQRVQAIVRCPHSSARQDSGFFWYSSQLRTVRSRREGNFHPMQQASMVGAATGRATPSAYISLMKPHVTVLLLGVTLAAMVVAADGLPRVALVLATLLGG